MERNHTEEEKVKIGLKRNCELLGGDLHSKRPREKFLISEVGLFSGFDFIVTESLMLHAIDLGKILHVPMDYVWIGKLQLEIYERSIFTSICIWSILTFACAEICAMGSTSLAGGTIHGTRSTEDAAGLWQMNRSCWSVSPGETKSCGG